MSSYLQARSSTQTTAPAEAQRVAPQGPSNSAVLAQLQATQAPTPRPRPQNETPQQAFQRQYLDQKDRLIDTTIPRWKRLSPQEAATLARTPEDERPAAGERGYSTTVNGATWQYDAFANDPNNPLRAKDMMGGAASQVYSRAFTSPNADHPDRQDVTILNADGTTTTQRGNEHGMAELPTSGFGFTTHNRNDVRVNGRPQPDQWGTPASVARIVNIMSDYRTLFPNSTLSIGDMSTDTGDSPRLYTGRNTRHQTHYDGSQVDLRYPDGEGSTNSASREAGDLFRERSLMRTAENWGMNYFHMSPTLNGQMFPAAGTDTHYNEGHRDHLHMGVR